MAGKKRMDFIREYASAPERYLPLHSDWKGRVKEEGIDPADQDTDYGWSAGTIGNRPWFLEYWGRWGIEMITVYLSADDMEEVTAADLDRMMEENRIRQGSVQQGSVSSCRGGGHIAMPPFFVPEVGNAAMYPRNTGQISGKKGIPQTGRI